MVDLLAPFRTVAEAPNRFDHDPSSGLIVADKGADRFVIMTEPTRRGFGLARYSPGKYAVHWFTTDGLLASVSHPFFLAAYSLRRDLDLVVELGLPELVISNFKQVMAVIPSSFQLLDANSEPSLTLRQSAALSFLGAELAESGEIFLALDRPMQIGGDRRLLWRGSELPKALSGLMPSLKLEFDDKGMRRADLATVSLEIKPRGRSSVETMLALNELVAAGLSDEEILELQEFCEAHSPE